MAAAWPLDVRRTESYFDGAGQGRAVRLRLFRRAWIPERPDRLVVLVHGYAEHSGRYEFVGRWLAERGCAVHAYDHRGHGRSQGVRCHVETFEHFLRDLDTFRELACAEHGELPSYLLGHSMGGLIVLAYLAEHHPPVRGAVVSAPALHVDAVPALRRMAARGLRRLWPTLELGSGLDPGGLSRDPEVVREYLEDPLVYRTMTASLGAAMLDAAEQTSARALEVQAPVLLLHGEADPICDAVGSRRFHEDLRATGSDLRLYPELRHEILNEPEREAVLEDLLSWYRSLERTMEGV